LLALTGANSLGIIVDASTTITAGLQTGYCGHEERDEPNQSQPSSQIVNARVAALNYRWSSYDVYAGRTKNPDWLTTDSIYAFFGNHTSRSLCGAYRRQLEKMAALGHWETDWKDKISATVLFSSKAFVRQIIKLFKGNRSPFPSASF
jgi:hypothetical protein